MVYSKSTKFSLSNWDVVKLGYIRKPGIKTFLKNGKRKTFYLQFLFAPGKTRKNIFGVAALVASQTPMFPHLSSYHSLRCWHFLTVYSPFCCLFVLLFVPPPSTPMRSAYKFSLPLSNFFHIWLFRRVPLSITVSKGASSRAGSSFCRNAVPLKLSYAWEFWDIAKGMEVSQE